MVRHEFFSFFLVSRAGCRFYACARRWRRWLLATAGFRSRAVCGPKMRARPGGRFRGRVGRAAAENRVAAVGAALGLAQRVCFAPIAPYRRLSNFFSKFGAVLGSPSDRALRAGCCIHVVGAKIEERARADSHAPLLYGELAAAFLGDQVLRSLDKLTRPRSVFFEHCYCERAQRGCWRAIGRLQAPFL